MKMKASVPKRSASLLLLRPISAGKRSLFDYELLVLQRMVLPSYPGKIILRLGTRLPWRKGRACDRLEISEEVLAEQ